MLHNMNIYQPIFCSGRHWWSATGTEHTLGETPHNSQEERLYTPKCQIHIPKYQIHTKNTKYTPKNTNYTLPNTNTHSPSEKNLKYQIPTPKNQINMHNTKFLHPKIPNIKYKPINTKYILQWLFLLNLIPHFLHFHL